MSYLGKKKNRNHVFYVFFRVVVRPNEPENKITILEIFQSLVFIWWQYNPQCEKTNNPTFKDLSNLASHPAFTIPLVINQ